MELLEKPDSEIAENLNEEASLNVFSIYGGVTNPKSGAVYKGGLFLGGLDTGMDLTQQSINFESKENLIDRHKSPFPSSNGAAIAFQDHMNSSQ